MDWIVTSIMILLSFKLLIMHLSFGIRLQINSQQSTDCRQSIDDAILGRSSITNTSRISCSESPYLQRISTGGTAQPAAGALRAGCAGRTKGGAELIKGRAGSTACAAAARTVRDAANNAAAAGRQPQLGHGRHAMSRKHGRQAAAAAGGAPQRRRRQRPAVLAVSRVRAAQRGHEVAVECSVGCSQLRHCDSADGWHWGGSAGDGMLPVAGLVLCRRVRRRASLEGELNVAWALLLLLLLMQVGVLGDHQAGVAGRADGAAQARRRRGQAATGLQCKGTVYVRWYNKVHNTAFYGT